MNLLRFLLEEKTIIYSHARNKECRHAMTR
jgi:hypothetical protein